MVCVLFFTPTLVSRPLCASCSCGYHGSLRFQQSFPQGLFCFFKYCRSTDKGQKMDMDIDPGNIGI